MTHHINAVIVLSLAATFAAPLASTTTVSAGEALPQTVQAALTSALMDEYHAEAFYSAVLERFGQVRPFANIIGSEQYHASKVAALMTAYGMDVPANTQLGSAEIAAAVPATLGAACAIGVQAEIANAALYDDNLLPAVSGFNDITVVLEYLRDASQNNHLPAFQRCAV
ncbi:DUF2202 domain-containing protein [Devosia sp. FKR38]|uniref:ferritin-like domain-containing protein n=1 Tax=Devosia sp. FKR38 TaxID=2562312 RepID=UPI00197AA3BC|nr:DUF2202 domain-containing protein [Devosia sp. FKR38]